MNNFEHRFLRIELIKTAVYKGVLVGVVNLHPDKKPEPRTGERCKDS